MPAPAPVSLCSDCYGLNSIHKPGCPHFREDAKNSPVPAPGPTPVRDKNGIRSRPVPPGRITPALDAESRSREEKTGYGPALVAIIPGILIVVRLVLLLIRLMDHH